MKPVIETHALCKSYHGRPVVDHLNLTVPEGCVYGFLGPNGAGKSTTMKMLLGLVHPTGGSVELLGHTLNEENRIGLLRQTGSLIESPSGYLHLTARENLSIAADLKGVDAKDIGRVLDIVHLTADADRKVGQYSLGMKQRLGIANAIMHDPELLILDEPTNGLDPIGIAEVRAFIRSLSEKEGKTILVSSHILSEISMLADDIGILDHGVLLEEETMEELKKKNQKYILLQVSDTAATARILEQQMALQVGEYSIQDTTSVKIFKTTIDREALVRELTLQGVGLSGLAEKDDTLEDYFKKITGGEGIA